MRIIDNISFFEKQLTSVNLHNNILISFIIAYNNYRKRRRNLIISLSMTK